MGARQCGAQLRQAAVRGGVVCPLRQAAVRVSAVHLYYRLDQNQSELIGTNPNQSEAIRANLNQSEPIGTNRN